MKKVTQLVFLLFFASLTNAFSQASGNFFVGKWDIFIAGTPQGDVKLTADFVRKDGKLTGELKDPTGQVKEVIPITSLEEEATRITIGFSAQGYDLSLPLDKVDDNNLKGSLMNMFETTAKRVVGGTGDFFAGKWDIMVSNTPRGDVTFKTDLVRKDGKLTGELVNADDRRAIKKIEEAGNKISIFFESSQGGEISIELEKVDDNNLKGALMGYDAKAVRVK